MAQSEGVLNCVFQLSLLIGPTIDWQRASRGYAQLHVSAFSK